MNLNVIKLNTVLRNGKENIGGVHAHLDGDGQLLSEDAGDGGVDLIDVAHAEVAVEHIDPEAADLHRQMCIRDRSSPWRQRP